MSLYSLKLSRHRRARVWLEEAPNASYAPTRTARKIVSTGGSFERITKIAVVELAVPRGGMASYGLLGAELFDSELGNDGIVSVGIGDPKTPFHGSLAVMPDIVCLGLPGEYEDAIVAGVELVVGEGWQFQGEMHFGWAAHAAVGSSASFFGELATHVARLLAHRTPPDEEAVIANLR